MIGKVSLLSLILFVAAGCVTQPTATATSTLAVRPASAASSTPAAALSEQEAVVLANEFYDLFVARQDYVKAITLFDDQLKAALPESKLKEVWTALPQQVGTFQSRSDARLGERKDPYQRVIIPLRFEKTRLNMLVVVDMTIGKISGLFFQPNQEAQAQQYKTPSYVDAAKFEEKEVTVGAEPWTLPGILTLPKGTGPFPAIVLVHGSGPNDRDETIGPNKPFKDIAQGLASQGIAVLRYDKRTKIYPQEATQIENFTVKDETITDAVAAVEFLRRQPQINPQKVFVLGHSLGGYLAPRIAQADSEIAGMIILAGATRPLEDMMVEQTRYLLESDGSLSAEDQAQITQLQQQVGAVKALTEQSSGDKAILGAPASYWIDLKDYHPADLARSLTIPLLIVQGERDYQVTMQDFQNWQEALAGQANVTLKSYPSLNHLFISGDGKSIPAEYQTPGNVAPVIIQDMANWIQQRS
ncbi:MAG TPA: alpha/beta fold hydrolase [Anaerolineae bacterium]|nr:alpha/beta fold hydrolase [Anaerolineae bacterium]